jgi:branched-chain amino acid transport system permease protein
MAINIRAPIYDDDRAMPANGFDYVPLLLIPALALIGLAAVRNPSVWVTLTLAGIGMGFIVFLAASGLTLVFGLLRVMNFGHAAFVTLGAIFGGLMLWPRFTPLVACWWRSENLLFNLIAISVAIVIAMLVTVTGALIFERLIVRHCYGKPLATQVMLTIGGMIVIEQLIIAFIGNGMYIRKPPSLSGVMLFGDVAIERYRLMTTVVGAALFGVMVYVLNRTKAGMLIRASVEQRELVESMGYKVKHLFLWVFAIAAALASLSGLLYGIFESTVGVKVGANLMVPIFMVMIIGGMGSITGTCVAAVLVGMLTNYVGYVLPGGTAFATIAMVGVVGLWRPHGLYPVTQEWGK